MRTCVRMGFLICLAGLTTSAAAAPPKTKPAAPLPKVNADVLPVGTFSGVLVNPPDSDRMITLKITYPEVQLKPGAKPPNFRSMEAKAMHQIMQQMHNAQRSPRGRGGNRGGYHHHHASAMSNMMHQQQMYMQGQQRMAQAMARAQQQELRLLQQEIQAIQKMYQVVQVSRDFDFQLTQNIKVRTKELPDKGFDEKGEIKKYTKEELAEFKGKDKNLMGYESSLEALHPGQTVLVALRIHKKAKPGTLNTAAAKDKVEEKEIDDASVEHKMQVTVLVILKDGDAPKPSATKGKKNKK